MPQFPLSGAGASPVCVLRRVGVLHGLPFKPPWLSVPGEALGMRADQRLVGADAAGVNLIYRSRLRKSKTEKRCRELCGGRQV
jgi:hypothetical protein